MTLSTSADKNFKTGRTLYIVGTIFCIVFALVYEFFSHQVYSPFMVLAFLIPLIGWILTELYYKFGGKKNFGPYIFAGGIIWLTLGSIFKGILDIYGTTNHLAIIFPIVGGIQLIAGIIVCISNYTNKTNA